MKHTSHAHIFALCLATLCITVAGPDAYRYTYGLRLAF